MIALRGGIDGIGGTKCFEAHIERHGHRQRHSNVMAQQVLVFKLHPHASNRGTGPNTSI